MCRIVVAADPIDIALPPIHAFQCTPQGANLLYDMAIVLLEAYFLL